MKTKSFSLKQQLQNSLRSFGKGGSWSKSASKGVERKLPKYLGKSKSLFSNIVRREFFNQNCRAAYDEKKIAYLDLKTDTMYIYYKTGRKVKIKNVFTRNYVWSPDCTKIVYVKNPEGFERTTQALWLIDVVSGKKSELYKTDEDIGSVRGVEWAPDGVHVYSIELLEPAKGLPTHNLIRINAVTKKMEIVRSMITRRSIYCFFNPPTTTYEYTGKAFPNMDYQLLYGTPRGLYLSSPDGKEKKKITDFSARGCDNTEWAPDLSQIALNFNGYGKPGEKRATGVYIYRVTEDKLYKIYPKRDIHTLWWSPDSKIITFCNTKTLWAYKFVPADEQKGTKADYHCIFQIWIPPSPADLTLEVLGDFDKKSREIRLKIKAINQGEGSTKKTYGTIYLGKDRAKTFPLPALEGGKTFQVPSLNGKSPWLTLTLSPNQVVDKIWVSLGMNRKMAEISHKNNYVGLPLPMKKGKVYKPKSHSVKVLLLSQVMANQRITGFYWSKDSKKILITAGRWLYALINKDGKYIALPLLKAPKKTFFGRPTFFGGEVLVTNYSFAPRPEKKRRK